jgi:hypothetical protein
MLQSITTIPTDLLWLALAFVVASDRANNISRA